MELFGALKDVSEVVTVEGDFFENLENKGLEESLNLIDSLSVVSTSLQNSAQDIFRLLTDVKKLRDNLNSSCSNSGRTLSEIRDLDVKCQLTKAKFDVLDSLIHKFQLLPEQVSALRHDDISDQFFTALRMADCIHTEANKWLQVHPYAFFLDVVEQMSVYQNSAYSRLYDWCISSLKASHCDNELLQKGLAVLQDIPSLFQPLMDEFAKVDADVIAASVVSDLHQRLQTRAFCDVDLISKHISDMLFGVYRGISQSLLRIHSILKKCDINLIDKVSHSFIVSVCDPLCGPLRQRLEEIISPEQNSRVLHHCSRQISSRLFTFSLVIKSDNPLFRLLTEQMQNSRRFLEDALIKELGVMSDQIKSVDRDFLPSPAFGQVISLLSDILDTGSSESLRESSGEIVFSSVLPSFIAAVRQSCQGLAEDKRCMYMANCLEEICDMLEVGGCQESYVSKLADMINAEINTCVLYRLELIIDFLKIRQLITCIETSKSIDTGSAGVPLSLRAHADEGCITTFNKQLGFFLREKDIWLHDRPICLLSRRNLRAFHRGILDMLLRKYCLIHEAVYEEGNLYSDPSSLLPIPPCDLREEIFDWTCTI